MTTPDQHYRFLPYDYDSGRVQRTTISDSELQDYLTNIGGKKIFFFDTCYSGAILKWQGTKYDARRGQVRERAQDGGERHCRLHIINGQPNYRRRRKSGVTVLLPRRSWKDCAARRGDTDSPVITVNDLGGYVSRRVKDLTNGDQRPMMAMPKTVEDFPVSVRRQ